MPRTGRPRIEIKQDLFEGLARILCTKDEICGILNVSEPTLRRWVHKTYKGQTFDAVQKAIGDQGRMSLRRAQMRLAESGNATMLIWLGKQHLNQRDEVRNYNFDLSNATDEQLDRLSAGEDPAFVLSTSSRSGAGETPSTADDSSRLVN